MSAAQASHAWHAATDWMLRRGFMNSEQGYANPQALVSTEWVAEHRNDPNPGHFSLRCSRENLAMLLHIAAIRRYSC